MRQKESKTAQGETEFWRQKNATFNTLYQQLNMPAVKRIVHIMEAYRIRVAKMSQILNSSLLVKRDNLVAQIHMLDYRMEEIKFVRTVIERDARSEYGGIIERLKSSEG